MLEVIIRDYYFRLTSFQTHSFFPSRLLRPCTLPGVKMSFFDFVDARDTAVTSVDQIPGEDGPTTNSNVEL